MFVGLAGHISFQAAHDLGGVQPVFSPSCHITAGVLVRGHAGEDDAVEGGVGLTVSAPVESEPGGCLARVGGEWGDPADAPRTPQSGAGLGCHRLPPTDWLQCRFRVRAARTVPEQSV